MELSKRDFDEKYQQAIKLCQQGSVDQSRNLLLGLLKKQNVQNNLIWKEAVLFLLAEISIQSRATDDAINYCKQLIQLIPTKISYIDNLAKIYAGIKKWQCACDCYKDFIKQNKPLADAFYNYAYYLKQAGEFELSLKNYQLAIDNKVMQPEEVFLNMAVIYSDNLRREEMAKKCLSLALTANANYSAAVYNLANLYEEEGNQQKAKELFEKTISIQPTNYQALARIADVKTFTNRDDSVITKLEKSLRNEGVNASTKVNLYYALGKAFDDCGQYDKAFEYYKSANTLDSKTIPPYNKKTQEINTEANIHEFSKEWFSKQTAISDEAPIFICGMFRSGSTLTEQIIASHPDMIAGGEREYFLRKIHQSLQPYPKKITQLNINELKVIAEEYLSDLYRAFPDCKGITDKRPDNFLYIGLIKTLFPNAKIVYTKRNALDNCISIYFLRLGSVMNYATSIENIAHYYKEHEKLIAHWKGIFSDSIFEVNYDRLVSQQESETNKLLSFLKLPWHDDCLKFYELKNRVKTASVWKVRQPIYTSSSGRSSHYEKFIKEATSIFEY